MASCTVSQNLKIISDMLRVCYMNAPTSARALTPPRLVAVSKTKPKEMIIEAYSAGHRHFGENYVQELEEKSNDPELLNCCPDIRWHFIGKCQTKNARKLSACKRLAVIETITSIKLADKLQAHFVKKHEHEEETFVNVMIQVNTSAEENKNGVQPGPDVISIVNHIKVNCPNLIFLGLMTIGALGNSLSNSTQHGEGHNPDFLVLIESRQQLASFLQVEEKSIELSMGMSNDFSEAISMGSSNVRIGSSIFGARNYPPKPITNT